MTPLQEHRYPVYYNTPPSPTPLTYTYPHPTHTHTHTHFASLKGIQKVCL